MKRAPQPLDQILEREWDSQLFGTKQGLAQSLGWRLIYHTLRSKGSAAGFPDRVLVRERVIFAELKREKTGPTPGQVEWLDGLAAAGAEVYLWRPSDLDEIGLVLGARFSFGQPDHHAGTRMLWSPTRAPWTPRTLWMRGGTYGEALANELARSA